MTDYPKILSYVALMRLNKPIGILLLLWPTLWALWCASHGAPDPGTVAVFVVGVVLMRSAGCVFNDLLDRDLDAKVQRTRMRPLATGALSVRSAWKVLAVLLSFSALLVVQLNWQTIGLSLLAVLLVSLYPMMKRWTYFPQFFLGMTFSWSVPMAYAAQLGYVPLIGWYLTAVAALWTVIYDTFYAMADLEDDKKIGIKSTAVLWNNNVLAITRVLQGVLICLLVLLGYVYGLQTRYYVAVGLAAGLCCYQQYLVKDRVPARCIQAFMNNHYLGMTIFLGMFFSWGVTA